MVPAVPSLMSCSTIRELTSSLQIFHSGSFDIVAEDISSRCAIHRKKLEDLSQLISVWQFDFKPVMMTAPRSFVTIGFSVQLPVSLNKFNFLSASCTNNVFVTRMAGSSASLSPSSTRTHQIPSQLAMYVLT